MTEGGARAGPEARFALLATSPYLDGMRTTAAVCSLRFRAGELAVVLPRSVPEPGSGPR